MKRFEEGETPLRVRKGRIVTVDREHWTCSVVTSGGEVESDIPINPIYLGPDGQGMFYLPEVDSIVWLGQIGEEEEYFILMGAPVAVDREETGDSETEAKISASNYRANRPVLNQGDMMIKSQDESFVAVRSSGVVEVGAGPMAKRFYIPIQNLVRDFAKAWEVYTAGGNIRMDVDESDNLFGQIGMDVLVDRDETADKQRKEMFISKTPTRLVMSLKEFAQDKDPVITLQMGRTKLDTNDGLVGSRGTWKDIVFELLIQDPDPDISKQGGETKGGTSRIWIDKKGTLNSCFFGTKYSSCEEDEINWVEGDKVIRAGANYRLEAGARHVKVRGSDTEEILGSAEKYFREDVKVTVDGQLEVNLKQPIKMKIGEKEDTVNGSSSLHVQGEYGIDTTKNLQISVGGDSKELVAGHKSITAWNKTNPAKPSGMTLRTMGGMINLSTLPLNPSDAIPYNGGIKLDTIASVLQLDPQGNINMYGAGGAYGFEINASGISMQNLAGVEVSINASGKINLGMPTGAGSGNVVTTLTHPFCFVTGLPIRGSSSVAVYSVNPVGTPGPNVPSPVSFINASAAAKAAIKAVKVAEKLIGD